METLRVCVCLFSFFLFFFSWKFRRPELNEREKGKFSHARSQGHMQLFGVPRQTQSSDNNKVNNKVNYENKHSDSLISSD